MNAEQTMALTRMKRAIQMVREGTSYSEAATVTGVSYSTVYCGCRRHGIRALRSRGHASDAKTTQYERIMDDDPLATECYESSLATMVVPVRPLRPAPEHVCTRCGHAGSRETLRVQQPGKAAVERVILRCLNRKRQDGLPTRPLFCGLVKVLAERLIEDLIPAPPTIPVNKYEQVEEGAMGRPRASDEIETEIAHRIMAGEAQKSIMATMHVGSNTVVRIRQRLQETGEKVPVLCRGGGQPGTAKKEVQIEPQATLPSPIRRAVRHLLDLTMRDLRGLPPEVRAAIGVLIEVAG